MISLGRLAGTAWGPVICARAGFEILGPNRPRCLVLAVMGRRGPPPKPTILKLVSGNPGGRPLNTREPVPPPIAMGGAPAEIASPAWLPPRAVEVWKQLVPRLASIGLARTLDEYMLARYCELLVMWMDDTAFLAKNGSKYPIRAEAKRGKPGRILGFKPWPEKSLILRINRELMAIEREFGMSPSARSRITTSAEKSTKGDVGDLRRKFLTPSAG